MTKIIRVLGIDPAFRSFGFAHGLVNIEGEPFLASVESLRLSQTEKNSNKTVLASSDKLRRAVEQYKAMQEECRDVFCVMAEIPSGGKSANAIYGFGIAVGILASCPVPLIQVTQQQVKLATVGKKNAAKEDMREYAMSKFPHAGWLIAKSGRTKGQPTADNEHLADAVAVIEAGIRTDQFLQAVAMFKGSLRRAV